MINYIRRSTQMKYIWVQISLQSLVTPKWWIEFTNQISNSRKRNLYPKPLMTFFSTILCKYQKPIWAAPLRFSRASLCQSQKISLRAGKSIKAKRRLLNSSKSVIYCQLDLIIPWMMSNLNLNSQIERKSRTSQYTINYFKS